MQTRMRFMTLVILFITRVSAMWPQAWIIGETCHRCAQVLTFETCNSQDIKCLCTSRNYLATVSRCITQHARKSATQRDSAWDHFTTSVCEINNAEISDKDYQDAQNYLMGTEAIESNGQDALWQPAIIPERQYRIMYKAVYNNLKQKDTGVWTGSFLVGYWVFVMILSAFGRFLRYISVRFSHKRVTMARPGKFSRWVQRRLVIPACFGLKHMSRVNFLGMNFMIPTRFETLVIGVYFILNIVFMVTPYDFVQGENPLYDSHEKEMMRYVSDRSGIIATIQIPLFTIFALRNNICQWFTGWNYTVFNTYHRAVARVCYLQLIVHAITKHIFSASYGASLVKYFYPLPYYRWGVAAMFLMALMIMSGQFRVQNYEWFLTFHILAAIGSFICSIMHLEGLGYRQPIYLAFGLWGADWLLRIGRIVFINYSLIMQPAIGDSKSTDAKVCLVGADLIWLKIRTPVHWKFKPGQYCFIHVNRLRFWEGHPFSIVYPTNNDESFQMMCKQRGGMTRRFVKLLAEKGNAEENPANMKVVVEGPYGVHCPVERYDTVMLIAGGIGITGVLPYVEWCTRQEHQPRILFVWSVLSDQDAEWVGKQLDKLAPHVNLEMLIFAMKHHEPESEAEKKANNQDPETQFTSIYLGNEDSSQSTSSGSLFGEIESLPDHHHYQSQQQQQPAATSTGGTEVARRKSDQQTGDDSLATLASDSAINIRRRVNWRKDIRSGRPNLPNLIEQFLQRADGSATVLGCGPPPMMDAIRSSVVDSYELCENGRVDYYEEAYSW